MSALPAIQDVGGVQVDYAAVLRTLKLDPRDPNTQALVLVCQQYELDPVLKHMILIQGAPYITHKGLWHMGHRSNLLDGHEVVSQEETDKEWRATVAIYRKDWTRPVTMTGRYPKSGQNKGNGPEMAVTRAECLVLRRLFDVAVPVAEEMDWPQHNDRHRDLMVEAPAKSNAPLEVVSAGPSGKKFAPPAAKKAEPVVGEAEPAAPTHELDKLDAAIAAKALLPVADDLTGVQPALMVGLRDALDKVTNDAVRKELAAKWTAANLPNVKAMQVVLSEVEWETATNLVEDAIESQAELEDFNNKGDAA